MASVISVLAKVQADASNFVGGMKQAETAVNNLKTASASATGATAKNFDAGTKQMGNSAIKLGGILATAAKGFLLFQGLNFMKSAVAGASAFEAEFEGVNQAFGDGAKLVQEYAKNAAMTAGLAEVPALRAAKSFGVFAKSAGLAGEDAGKFATGLVQAAGDLGSFYDLPTESALAAISSGLRGQTEPLRRFNILIGEAEMNQKSMEMGLGANSSALTQQQKVLVRQQLIMEGLGVAQGDFVKYQDTYGNSIKTVGALFQNLQKDVGAALLPVLAKLAGALVPIITQLGPILTKVFEALVPVIQAVVDNLDSFMPVLDPLVEILRIVAEVFAEMITAILPPFIAVVKKLLPPIVKIVDIFAKLAIKMLPAVMRLFDSLMPIIEMFIDYLNVYALPVLEALAGVMGDALVWAADALAGAFKWLASILKPIWEGVIKPLLEGLMAMAGIKTIKPKVEVQTTGVDKKTGGPSDFDFATPNGGGDVFGAAGGSGSNAAAERKKQVKDTAKTFKELLKALIPVKALQVELGKFEQDVVNNFDNINKAIRQSKLDKIITKKEANALKAYSETIRKELRAIAAERDALDKKLSELNAVKAASVEFVRGMDEMLKSTMPLVRVEEEIGRFESAVIGAFDSINSKIEDGLSLGLLTDKIASELKASAATTKKALSDIARQRDELAKSYNSMVEKLSAARDFRRATKESVQGFADITAMGRSARSMIIGLTKLVKQTNTFANDLSTLQAMGLNKQAYNSILQAGKDVGGATARGLIKGGVESVTEINRLYASLETAGEKIGTDASNYMFDGGETAIISYIKGIVSQDEELRKQAEASATAFNTLFQTTINAAQVSIQSQIDALLAQQTELENAATTLAEAFNAKFASMLNDFSAVGNQASEAGKAAEAAAGGKGGKPKPTLTPKPVGKPMTQAQMQAAIVADKRASANININVKAGLGSNPAAIGKEVVGAIKSYERSSGRVAI
jgi:phage-related protein